MSADETPLSVADAAARDTLRSLFATSGFSEAVLRKRPGLEKLELAGDTEFHAAIGRKTADDAQSLLVRLFLAGHSVPVEVFDEAFTEAQRRALGDTGLVESITAADGDRKVRSPVVLSPVAPSGSAEVHIAADRLIDTDGVTTPLPVDVVFSGHNPLTRQFLGLLPATGRGAALDLCAGSGVAAVVLAGRFDRVVAADLCARSLRFTQFNQWLNGAEIRLAQGDLYQAIGSDRFDLICAHPPYVPTLHQTAIFRDGGSLGDTIVSRVIAGAPDHLNVGGTLYLLCMGMDTEEAPFERRVRAWLGDDTAFDVVLAVDHFMSAPDFAEYIVRRTRQPAPDEHERWATLFREHHVIRVVYGAVMGRRLPPGTAGDTRRVQMNAKTTWQDFERLFAWLECQRQPGFAEALLNAKIGLAAGGRLEVHHEVVNGAFEPTSLQVGNGGRPFPALVETEPWIASLLSTMGAQPSLRQAVQAARTAERLPEPFGDADAVRVVSYMVERGILEIVEEPHG